MILRFILACLFAVPSFAVWSNHYSTNAYTWEVDTGWIGGFPNRTTIHSTQSAGASHATVQAAFDACTSNQVVALEEGEFSHSSSWNLSGEHGVTVRGATNANGHPTTILHSTASIPVNIDANGWSFAGSSALSGGYEKYSTMVTFSSTPNAQFSVGNMMKLTSTDPDDLVYTASASLGQNLVSIHCITNVSGNNVHFDPPLPWTHRAADNPVALYLNGGPGTKAITFENIIFDNAGGANDIVNAWGVYLLGFKNCYFSNMVQSAIFPVMCSRVEIRHCRFYPAAGFPDNADGYSIYPHTGTTAIKVEDNIFEGHFTGHWQTDGGMAMYAGYNFYTNAGAQGITDRQLADIRSNHGACPAVNLTEGNIFTQFHTDAYHGNDIHHTIFRNYAHTKHPTATGNIICMSISRGSYYYEVVGNILGHPSLTYTHFQMTGQPDYFDQDVIYRDGYPGTFGNGYDPGDIDPNWPRFEDTGTYPDARVASTMIRHANYDKFNGSIQNLGGQDTTLPDSLVYSSKPAFFGAMSFPPWSPSTPNPQQTNLPAAYRYVTGLDTPQEAGGGGSSGGGTVNVNALRIGTIQVAP